MGPSYLHNDTTTIQREIHRYLQALDLTGVKKTVSSTGLGEGASQHKLMLRARIARFEPKSTGDTEYARNWLAK